MSHIISRKSKSIVQSNFRIELISQFKIIKIESNCLLDRSFVGGDQKVCIISKNASKHFRKLFDHQQWRNTYLDTTENIVVGETEPDSTNCLYFATCTDFTSHESINSDTAKYYAQQELQCEFCCENCDALSLITNSIDDQQNRDFNIKNYPNPFNPVTNLEFGIPDLGFVSPDRRKVVKSHEAQYNFKTLHQI